MFTFNSPKKCSHVHKSLESVITRNFMIFRILSMIINFIINILTLPYV